MPLCIVLKMLFLKKPQATDFHVFKSSGNVWSLEMTKPSTELLDIFFNLCHGSGAVWLQIKLQFVFDYNVGRHSLMVSDSTNGFIVPLKIYLITRHHTTYNAAKDVFHKEFLLKSMSSLQALHSVGFIAKMFNFGYRPD